MAIKLQAATSTTAIAERKHSEAEKPWDNWHFIADFLHLLSARCSWWLYARVITLSFRLDVVSKWPVHQVEWQVLGWEIVIVQT